MYELVQVAENTYYINAPSKIGVYRVSDDDIWLIDSGNDKDAGRKIQKILDVEDQRDANFILIHHAGVSLFLRMSLNGTLFRGSDYMALLIREVKLPLEISLFLQFSDDRDSKSRGDFRAHFAHVTLLIDLDALRHRRLPFQQIQKLFDILFLCIHAETSCT